MDERHAHGSDATEAGEPPDRAKGWTGKAEMVASANLCLQACTPVPGDVQPAFRPPRLADGPAGGPGRNVTVLGTVSKLRIPVASRTRLAGAAAVSALAATLATGPGTARAATWDGFVTDAGCGSCTAVVDGDTLATGVGGSADAVDTAYGTQSFGSVPARLWLRDVLRLREGYTLSGDLILLQVLDGANRIVYQLSVGTDRRLVVYSPPGGLRSTQISTKTSVVVPADGSERRVEVSALRNDSLILRVDGVDRLTIAGLSGATTTAPARLRAGIIRYGGSSTNDPQTAWHRAVATSQSGWLGDPGLDPPPAPPSGLVASPDAGSVALDWASSPEPDLAGYHVYRAGPLPGPPIRLTSSLLTSSAYTDPAAPPAVTSTYRVTAVDAAGNESPPAPVSATPGGDPVIAAAGDIACDPLDPPFNGGAGTGNRCRQLAVSDLLAGASAVLALGDNQYECAGYQAFLASYDKSWGRFRSYTRPAIGNHEYLPPAPGFTDCDASGQAGGYFDYFNGPGAFGGPAGDRDKAYYSYDLGSWHVVVLNTECAIVSCAAGSPQETWLRQDLAASQADCTLAHWHNPLFSSGRYRPGIAAVRPLYQALYEAGVDVLVTAHEHNYERFAPQDALGNADPLFGVRQFIVGTGGHSFYAQASPIANSEVRNATSFGVLRMTLAASGYSWQFVPATGSFTDSGSGDCHGRPDGGGSVHSFAAAADSFVKEAAPTVNYGGSDLYVEGGADPDAESYLRFDVSGLSGDVQRAVIRLFPYTDTVDGPWIAPTATSWGERQITWQNRPAVTGPPHDDKGQVPRWVWLEYDVTDFVTGDGTFSFVLATDSDDSVSFYSREDAKPPELVITTG
jgi:hypothetical protein